ncbi:hypothetical protein [Metabacillus fastidiosus]|uniref:hypothetical protein n=1 Tax=Metabacillus fastidiosus TaxID=1458 RepID=UPI002E2123A3|nr:hypothetical protein [Metabacillus fastidiosus]
MLNMLEKVGVIQERYKDPEVLKREVELIKLRLKRVVDFSILVHLIVDENKEVSRQFKKRIEPYRLLLKGATDDLVLGEVAKECLELFPYLIEYVDKKSPETFKKIEEVGKRITDHCNEIADAMAALKAKEW